MKTIFSKREKLSLSLLCVLFLSTYFLYLFNFFVSFPFADVILHFLSGFFLALFFIGYFSKVLITERSLLGDLVIIIGASLLVGVGWEIFEFILDLILPCDAICLFRGGDLFDTLKDLVVDSAGATAMFFIIRQKHRKSALFK